MPDQHLRILAVAIPDVGAWTWWNADLPGMVQLEFTGVQLWFPPLRDGAPPAGHIGLRFHDVIGLNFITRREATHFPADWPRLMNEDRLGPLPVWNGGFVFNDDRWLRLMLRDAGHIETAHGVRPEEAAWARAPIRLAFGAGPVLCAISATRLTFRSHAGEIPRGDLAGLHAKWWDYQREYWKKRGKRDALPYDAACEVTYPVFEKKAFVPAVKR